MKKFLLAAAGLSAVAAAAPAAAQYYPQQQYGYNQQYGYGQQQYGYNQQYGYGRQQYGYANQRQLIQAYIARADQLRARVERFDNRDRINEREARRLRDAAVDLQNRTRSYARNGIDPNEQRNLDVRFANLQQRIAVQARDGNRYGRGYGQGMGGGRFVDQNRNGIDDRQEGFLDRDRDGRDDRYEDDRGRYPG
jgi:opacity protein-like surface antigen